MKYRQRIINSSSLVLLSLLALMATQLQARETLKVSSKDSEVVFSGEHAGMTFSGIFEKWQGSLRLPPLEKPSIEAEFHLGSANTGDATYDSTLPEGDWFDVKNHPKGKFKSTTIISKGSDFEVQGKLTLRGIEQAVVFVLQDKGDSYEAKFDINRLKYKIGMESDPEAEWVSKTINMHMTLKK
ncbi:YceI family protein [Glaciecola sp. MH2013]|uniref:YceI family protein n=1 Tax=Glaciecola sp. MH2013 TaxID=2785524 RepID=UPI00189FEBE6|nr:YceI family protein [Glaciecola sp. MH2013]MBF7073892.1 YceI family protein [Glaciecola sp. MH2013]